MYIDKEAYFKLTDAERKALVMQDISKKIPKINEVNELKRLQDPSL